MDQINLSNIGRGSPKDHLCQIIFKSAKLNGCVDPDNLNKAVVLVFGLALGANDNPTLM